MIRNGSEKCTSGRDLLAIAVIALLCAGCQKDKPAGAAVAPTKQAPSNTLSSGLQNAKKDKDTKYDPPTAEESSPMRPEYLAEISKLDEPPEMADKPMRERKPISPAVVQVGRAIEGMRDPEKATHDQRAAVVTKLLALAAQNQGEDSLDLPMLYGAAAGIACIDGENPLMIIEYLGRSPQSRDDNLALRARMYLKSGSKQKALDDLQVIMEHINRTTLTGGDAQPREISAPCGWSVKDFDEFGDDPRGLAAKGLYLSSFLAYGDENKKSAAEATLHELYRRSADGWRSPIPHVLSVTLGGLGSQQSMNRARCIRGDMGGGGVPAIAQACADYDEGIRRKVRELTMALVIEPSYAPALSERANEYLSLAQGAYSDGKPSRALFQLAVSDFTAAIAAGSAENHTMLCDRSLALAMLGRYDEAAAGYIQGMKAASGGTETSPFVYEQLARIYTRLGKHLEAAQFFTQAIMNASGGGMDVVIFEGGMKGFRSLYPEYDLLPDEILADEIRRRYQPQFQKSWDESFIAGSGLFKKGELSSTILPELYVLRGDAYLKAGQRRRALAEYQRVKSDAWGTDSQYLPRNIYFNARGDRNPDAPEAWPPVPPIN